MNRDTLDKLLIDRELGEMPAEVVDLLEAYLASRPDRKEAESQVAATIELARRALGAEGASVEAPPPPWSAVLGARARRKSWAVGRWVQRGAVAALIVLSFVAGERMAAPPGTAISILPVERRIENGSSAASASGFWSVARLKQETASRIVKSHRSIEWAAPFVPALKGEQS